jgi:large subunit ribosomal protein L6
MSRVGKKPIVLPASVEATINGQDVGIKGPKGELSCTIHPVVTIALTDTEEGKVLTASIVKETDVKQRAQWGTARACINNMVQGVTEGFSKSLEVNGVGYRVALQGKTIVLNVGYSHEVKYDLPEGIDATVEGNVITISGINRHLVGQTTAEIRLVRKPEPYKGKGIKYTDEIIRRKAGKAAKAGE